jgi:hypothetical protein
MKLDELIAQTLPLPYTWINDHTATFEFKGITFIIALAPTDPIKFEKQKDGLRGLHIAFGIATRHDSDGTYDLNTELTGLHNARLVIATVTYAIIDKLNSISSLYDFIAIVSKNDAAMSSRTKIYRAAVIDVTDHLTRMGYQYTYQLKNELGAGVFLISKIELTQWQAQFIAKFHCS